MHTKILEDVGLTKREAEVYEILLRRGESPMRYLLLETEAHPQVVYRVVETLSAKGLVTTVLRKNRKYLRAEDPRILERLEERRLKRFRQALPDLLELQTTPPDSIIRVEKGNDAVHDLRLRGIEALKKGDTYYIIGGSGDRYYEVVGRRYAALEKKRIAKGIRKKLIAFRNERQMLNKNDVLRTYAEFRYLPESYAAVSSINIFKNTVAILVWSAEPIVITIESAEVAESYRQYFASLWKTAKS